jgi:hypothetical protein
MKRFQNYFAFLIPLAVVFFAAAPKTTASIITYAVTFETGFLADPSYDLDLQFAQGDPLETGSNTVSVTNLSIPGSSDFSFDDGLPPFSGEEDITFAPGNPITFTIMLTSNVTSQITPDLLAITIFDNSTGNPVTTTDPNTFNSSLIYFSESLDPANPGITPAVYDTPAGEFQTDVALTPAPEPGTLVLGALICMIPSLRLRRRAQDSKS